MERVGWGVLGAGAVAATFASDLALLPQEARLVAVGSRDATRADAFAAAHGFARSHGSYAGLATDPEVDVVYVATAHSDHLASARQCLEAGKAVLVEKPLTVTATEGAALLDLAKAQSRFAMEAVRSRANPLIRRAAELVRSDALGPVRHLAASFGFRSRGKSRHWSLDPGQGGGAILGLGVYPVHLAQLVLGEPSALTAAGTVGPTGVVTHAAALLTCSADGQRATAALTCSVEADLPNRLDIVGVDGSIRVEELHRPTEMTVHRGGAEPERLVTQWPGHGYTFEAQEVMRCLRAGELESPLVPWADTLASLRTLDRWRAALAGGEA